MTLVPAGPDTVLPLTTARCPPPPDPSTRIPAVVYVPETTFPEQTTSPAPEMLMPYVDDSSIMLPRTTQRCTVALRVSIFPSKALSVMMSDVTPRTPELLRSIAMPPPSWVLPETTARSRNPDVALDVSPRNSTDPVALSLFPEI